MKQWVTKGCGADLQRIAERYHISPVLAEVLVKRGLHNWEEMDGYLFEDMLRLPQASEMYGLTEAAELLQKKLAEGKSLRVIGDYDVDGVMSTYILCHGLERLGGVVSSRIPHRQKDGYGMRAYMAQEAYDAGVDTIITCDNGISATEAIDRAKALGMTVILTDHHEVPSVDGEELLPAADVIVDPKQERESYPFRELCGAGVAYKLISYLYEQNNHAEWTEELLPFVALATVCDVVPLVGENRSLVKRGLALMQKTEQTGLRALIRELQFQREIVSSDLGFRIGPCINAPGRLQDAVKGFELFMETDAKEAENKARTLVELNQERREITRLAVEDAVQQIEGSPLPPVLVVYLPTCHESVAGIVAGRLREKYYRPVFLVTDSGGQLKGSGRSIPGYHMQQALLARREDLLEFGGHAMAAGFSLRKDRLEILRQHLLEDCRLSDEDLIEKVYYDREVSLSELDTVLAQQLTWLEPTGEANPSAVFVKREALIGSVRMCGKDMHIAQIRFVEDEKAYQAVDFQGEERLGRVICRRYGEDVWEELKHGGAREKYRLTILFALEVNDRYGSIQLRLIDCQ